MELGRVMQETSKMLSMLSHYTGFVLTPSVVNDQVRRLELIKLDGNNILAVLVTVSGLIRHKVIVFEGNTNSAELGELNRMLNRNIAGLDIKDIGTEIIRKLHTEKVKQERNLQLLEILLQQAFNLADESELYLEGTGNILSQPDFSDYDKLRNIFKVIDEKKMLTDVLETKFEDRGVRVLIGEESTCKDLEECSIVTSTYRAGDKTMGALGIIGPKRMEYSKMIALVDYFSKIINKTLNRQKKEHTGEPRKK